MTAPPLTLNIAEGSISFQFTPAAAQALQTALNQLMVTLKATAAQGGSTAKATPQKPLEYQYTGDVFLEIFCNPNIWPSPFAAKALITVRDDRMRLTTEAELNQIVEAVSQYLEQVA